MKLRVPQYGAANKIVWVDDEATKGAVAGTNLFLSDGKTLVTDDMLTGGSSGGASATLTTTDELNEGKYRLYFTSRRAQDAVGSIVGNSANVTLTYTGGTSLVADLTNVTVASGGTLKKRTFDAKGRLSAESAATTSDLTEGTNLYYTDARAAAAAPVQSVNGKTGTVSLTASDVGAATTAQGAKADSALQSVVAGTNVKVDATDPHNPIINASPGTATMPAGYIDGLKMQWVSGTALTVSSGAAYIQGSSSVLAATSAIAKTGLSLTASTWYHVYLYSNAGTPDIEIVTTAPDTAYSGTARSKTGDSSRRYIGSVLTDGSGSIHKFAHVGGIFVKWYTSVGNAPFQVLSTGTATTTTNVSLAGCIPATAKLASIQFFNNDTTATARLGNSSFAATLSTSAWLARAYPLGSVGQLDQFCDFPVDASQNFNYLMTGSLGSGGLTVRCAGYVYER